MIIHNDLKELFQFLNENDVAYVIVGGYAVAFHGFIRATKGIDILFQNNLKNIKKLSKALERFGIDPGMLDQNTFSLPGRIIRIGSPPMMVEFINAISGVSFEKIWESKVQGTYGGVNVVFISRENLLRNKKAAGRPQDLRDIEELIDNTE